MESNQFAPEIFGHSDSELSSDEEEVPRQKKAAPRRTATPSGDDDESSGAESADNYGGAGDDDAAPKRRKKKKADTRGDSERATRKRKRRVAPPEEGGESTQQKEAQLDAIFDKPKKTSRRSKKKKGDDDVLDQVADQEVSRLREDMLLAADRDEEANKEHMPAMHKLRLLPQVVEVLRRASHEQSIVDNNLLAAVKRWLEPLPDRSLPALNIQLEFFRALPEMKFINTDVLKESELGRIVLFYAKCQRVTIEVSRAANELVSHWSRPIIKRSASYRDRVVPIASITGNDDDPSAAPVVVRSEKLNTILARAREEDRHRVRKNAVAIPQRQIGTYTIAPRQKSVRSGSGVDADVHRRRQNADRLREMTKKVNAK